MFFWILKIVYILALTTLLFLNHAHAQQTIPTEKRDFDIEIEKLTTSVSELNKSNQLLKKHTIEQDKRIETLQGTIEANQDNFKKDAILARQETQKQLLSINQQVWDRTLLWIIITIIVMLFTISINLILRRKLATNTSSIEDRIKKTRTDLEIEGTKLDSKFMEILETQLKIVREDAHKAKPQEAEPDHSLALRVGEEIHRMRKRIANMPEETKGLGALKNSLIRLEDEFNASGYQIVDLLGKSWNEGLTVNARLVPSDELNLEEHIITKIIKPQINFKGTIIKEAEVEVSMGG